MIPEKLWQAFTAETYPKNDLVTLAKGLFFGKPFGKLDAGPRKVASDVASHAGVSPEDLYSAMNKVPLGGTMNARKILGIFGEDINAKRGWANTRPATRDIIEKTVAALVTDQTHAAPAAASHPRPPTAKAPSDSHPEAPAFPTSSSEPFDLYKLPFNKLYRDAVMMGEPRRGSRTGPIRSDPNPAAESDSNKSPPENQRQCNLAIAEIALAIRQGTASRQEVERVRDLATSCGMTKTAVELDRVARGLVADPTTSGHAARDQGEPTPPANNPEPPKSNAGKILLGATVVAAGATVAYHIGQVKK